jgi:hypothetical protein
MKEYTIYWQPQLQANFQTQCSFLNLLNPNYVPPVAEWVNGYLYKVVGLNDNQFNQVDQCANTHVCIDIKPSPTPPGNPHGR